MPCCNMTINNPRFAKSKCNDGCFCILTNGDDCICLFTDDDNEIKRCVDCKCDKSNGDCRCNDNPCASNKICTCIPTQGKSCVCVNVDKKGNIKVCDDCQCTAKETTKKCGKCNEYDVVQEELVQCTDCRCNNIKLCKDVVAKNCCGNAQCQKIEAQNNRNEFCANCQCKNKNKKCICLAGEGEPCVCISVDKSGKIDFCKDCQCITENSTKCDRSCRQSPRRETRRCNRIKATTSKITNISFNKLCDNCACSDQDKGCVCLATPSGACICVYTDKNGCVLRCEDCKCVSKQCERDNNNCDKNQCLSIRCSGTIRKSSNQADEERKCVCLATVGQDCICVYADRRGNIKVCEDCQCVSGKCNKCICLSTSKTSCLCDECQCCFTNNGKGNNIFDKNKCKNVCYCITCRERSRKSNDKLCDSCQCKEQNKNCVCLVTTDEACICVSTDSYGNVQLCKDCQCPSGMNLKNVDKNVKQCNKVCCSNNYKRLTTDRKNICDNCVCRDQNKNCVCIATADKACVCLYSDKRGSIQLCKDCECVSKISTKCSIDKKKNNCCCTVIVDTCGRVTNKICCDSDQGENCIRRSDKYVCVCTDKIENVQLREDCQCTLVQCSKSYSNNQCTNSQCNETKHFNKCCEGRAPISTIKCVNFTEDNTCVCFNQCSSGKQ